MKSIKKYIAVLAAAPLLWACSADEGTMPGTDPTATVTLYTYAPTEDGTNPDNDIVVRFVTNNKTQSVKYLLETTAEVDTLLAHGGKDALRNLIMEKGTELSDIQPDSYKDITLTDIHGSYYIVAVANGNSLSGKVKFLGLDWNKLKEGTFYYINAGVVGDDPRMSEASLEICTTDKMLYRIKNAFGNGTSLKMAMLDKFGKDADGKYQYFRVPPTETGIISPKYGMVSVRDIGYWQGDESFVTTGGYESGLYEDGSAFFCIQSYVSAGSFGYDYSYFIPYE